MDARSDHPPLATSSGSGSACTFAIIANNTLTDHEVEIRFVRSSVIVQRANFFSTDIDLEDRVLAPGENLNVRYEAPGSCGAPRNWYFAVGIGARGSDIMIEASTEGEADRDIHLGDSSCWAKHSDWGRLDTRPNPIDAGRRGCDVEGTEDRSEASSPADGERTQPAGAPPADPEDEPLQTLQKLRDGFDPQRLLGEWVRRDSNNPRNNGMRIRIEGDRATLIVMPPKASRAFRVGQVLWKDISSLDGTLHVRGSDGGYYSSAFTAWGEWAGFPTRLDIDVEHNGRGNDQTWERAGASIDGDWVLVDSEDPELSADFRGLQVRVEEDRGTVAYVTAVAAIRYRTGEEFWRGIEGKPPETQYDHGEGILEYRENATRSWREDTFELGRNGLLFVGAGEEYQVWARPEEAEEWMAAAERGETLVELPSAPGEDPDAAGGDLEAPDERTVDVPEELPPPEPQSEIACVGTSMPDDQKDLQWGWGLTFTPPSLLIQFAVDALPSDSRRGYKRASALPAYEGANRRDEIIVDLDRSSVNGLEDHHSFVWQANPRGRRWEEKRDLTLTAYKQANEDYRNRSNGGYRATDVEAYSTPEGVRYSGVWVANTEQIEWSTEVDLTRSEFERLYRESVAGGLRLVDIEVRSTPNGIRYSAVWHKSCGGSDWRPRLDMTRSEYQQRAENRQTAGFSLVDFESYRTREGQRYAALWERLSSPRAWRVRSDRTLKQYVNLHRQYVDLGFRLIDFESYDTADGVRYAGVWAENDPRYRYSEKNKLDATIEAYRQSNDVPGISVAVVQKGDVIYRRGFGYANVQTGDTAHAETVYLTASVSKVIGATLAVRLEETEGVELDLGTSTRSYLPSLPPHHTHTVEQLLAKTGCVWHYPEGPEPNGSNFYRWRVPALVQIWNAPLLRDCDPGKHYRYSTHGFTFVGAVLEDATGKDIAQLLRDELARPFGLPSLRAMFTADGEKGYPYDANRAKAYTLVDTTLLPSPLNPSLPTDYENNSWKVLGGGIEIHAFDLARFGWKLLNGEIVSETALQDRLWKSQTVNATGWNDVRIEPNTGQLLPPISSANIPGSGVGMSWVLGSGGNGKHVRHGGSARGARSHIRIWRDQDLVVAVLSNRRPHPIGSLVGDIANVVLNATPP